jgi:hypothetical protein
MSDSQGKISSLIDNPDYLNILKEAIDIEESGGVGTPWKDGWDYSDISESPQRLTQMVQEGLIEISQRRSSDPNVYKLSDLDNAKRLVSVVEDGEKPEADEDSVESEPEYEIPDDLFDNVIGHEPVKSLIMRCIESDEQIHFRLQGESSTAKSLFLTELERLPTSKYRSASGMTEVGLLDILMEQQPEFLLFDEIDKADNDCYTPLYELSEHGRVQKTISGNDVNIELDCNIIVTLNHPEKLPEELKKRMVKLEFEEYSDEDYLNVVTGVLMEKYELDEDVAEYIAEYQLNELGEKNVREPEQIAKLADNSIEDVKKVIEHIGKYRT